VSSRRLVAALVALVVVAGGCGGDDHAGPDPSLSDLTTAPVSGPIGGNGDGGPATGPPAGRDTDPTPYDEAGPYAAGVIDLALADGRRAVVWYPAAKAAADATPRMTFDLASLLVPELQARIPAEDRVPYEIDAHPGAAPAKGDGPFPVVLFSHGFLHFPEQ